MTSHIPGSLDNRILKNKTITVAVVKKKKKSITNKPEFFTEPGYRLLFLDRSSLDH